MFWKFTPVVKWFTSQNTIIRWVFPDSIRGYADKVSKSITGKPLIARLRELRKRHALTQEKVSELSGVSYKYYQLIEIGQRIDLRLSTLEKLAKAYGIGVHELLAPGFPKVRLPKAAAKKFKRTA
jgi:DNA-binding XRE family transcriptional regulator